MFINNIYNFFLIHRSFYALMDVSMLRCCPAKISWYINIGNELADTTGATIYAQPLDYGTDLTEKIESHTHTNIKSVTNNILSYFLDIINQFLQFINAHFNI